jgi:glycosyltransferase involved in cell wall biosynthesis
MRILIYYPYNYRSVEQQSVAEMLVKQGHDVYFLTTCPRGYIHGFLNSRGIKTYANEKHEAGIRKFLNNIRKLRSVISENKIEIVISHQQSTALIAGIVKKILPFKLIYIRHNSDEDYQLNAIKAKWFNRIINWLTPVKVAPSTVVKDFWTNKEGIPANKILRLNYGYNFEQYEKPDQLQVELIRKEFQSRLLVCSMARLVPSKRHKEMFAVINKLVAYGIDCRLICLGTGNLEHELKESIKHMGLQDRIFLLGRKENIFDYIQASDVFMHLSSTEASNSAIKEVGLCSKPVIVCKGVGDFDDYIENGWNGFLVNKEEPVEESYSILKRMAEGQINSKAIGGELYKTVVSEFDINNMASQYKSLLKK